MRPRNDHDERAAWPLGSLWGAVTHMWAISRGILDGPLMLRGASPVAAVVFAIFEFIPCGCITVAVAFQAHRPARPDLTTN